MEAHQIKQAAQSPSFLRKHFNNLLSQLPEKYRSRILRLINSDQAVPLRVAPATGRNPTKDHYMHQRMQDNMSEIMD